MLFVFSKQQIGEDSPAATGKRITEASLRYILGNGGFNELITEINDFGSALLAEHGGRCPASSRIP